jgi:hypothetical protein
MAVEVLVCQITTVARKGDDFINFIFTQFHILQHKIPFAVLLSSGQFAGV